MAIRLRPWHGALLLFVSSLTIHAAISLSIPAPTVFEDEYVVTGLARALAGLGREPILNKYYPGMSFLLTPIYWMTDNQQSVFRAGQALNVVLIATVAPLSFYVIRRLVPNLRVRYALVVGVIAMIYPSFLLTHTVIWSEALAIASVLGVGALIMRTWQRPTRGGLFLAGLMAGLLVLAHQRAVAAPIALVVVLVYFGLRRRVPRNDVIWTLFGVAIGGVLTLGALWAASVPVIRPSILDNVGTTGDPAAQQLLNFGIQLVGQSFFLLSSTGGLVALAIWASGSGRSRDVDDDGQGTAIVTSFFVVGSLILLVMSAGFLRSGSWRADFVAYGRYVELFVIPLILVGTAHLWNRTHRSWTQSRLLLITTGPIVVSGSILMLVYGVAVDDLPTNVINIVALSPATLTASFDLRIALGIGIILSLIVSTWLAQTQTAMRAAAAFSLIWSLAFAVAYIPIRSFSNLASESTAIPTAIVDFEKSTQVSVECIAYSDEINPWILYHYKWNITPRTLAPFAAGTCSTLLITTDDANVPDGAVLLIVDPILPRGSHRMLWRLPETP